jgi:hypothetical protein
VSIIITFGEPRTPTLFVQLHITTTASSSYLRYQLSAGNMSALASKSQSLKIFEKLKTKPANKVSEPLDSRFPHVNVS